MKALVIVSTIAVVLGILPLPYGFYMLLRIIICLTAVVGFLRFREKKDANWLWNYGIVAVLYNPVLPIHLLRKPLWILINIATIILLWNGLSKLGDGVPGVQRNGSHS